VFNYGAVADRNQDAILAQKGDPINYEIGGVYLISEKQLERVARE
jgi:hypothetical protein